MASAGLVLYAIIGYAPTDFSGKSRQLQGKAERVPGELCSQLWSGLLIVMPNCRNFAADLPLCPCTLEQAVLDLGRFRPDRECDKDSNPSCLRHSGAIHCVVSGTPV